MADVIEAGPEAAAGGAEAAGAAAEVGPSLAPRGLDLWSLITRPTGEGGLDQYRDHPLNPVPEEDGGARIARGLHGLLGGARWALADILLGAFALLRKAARPRGATTGGGA